MSTTPRQPDQVIAQAMLAAAAETPPAAITTEEVLALERLLAHAKRDSGQSRVVADFLLAWWNTGSCGAFDLTSLWALDTDIVADMTTILTPFPISSVAKSNMYSQAAPISWASSIITMSPGVTRFDLKSIDISV